jgi:hypothetical protein
MCTVRQPLFVRTDVCSVTHLADQERTPRPNLQPPMKLSLLQLYLSSSLLFTRGTSFLPSEATGSGLSTIHKSRNPQKSPLLYLLPAKVMLSCKCQKLRVVICACSLIGSSKNPRSGSPPRYCRLPTRSSPKSRQLCPLCSRHRCSSPWVGTWVSGYRTNTLVS